MRILIAVAVIFGMLFLGILVGIGFDRATWLGGDTRLVTQNKAVSLNRRMPTYETESNNLAYLLLLPNEKFRVVAHGGTVQPVMKFDGAETPCSEPDDTSSQCTVDPHTPIGGVYFFSCDAKGAAYNCPDPGIVVRDAPPIKDEFTLQYLSYFRDVGTVFGHVFLDETPPALSIKTEAVSAEAETQSQSGKDSSGATSGNAKEALTTAVQLQAHIVCVTSTKVVHVFPIAPPGAADSKISVPLGSSLAWVANYPFTVNLTSPYPCGAGIQRITSSLSDGINQAICQVAADATLGDHGYTASTGDGTCKTQNTEIITVTAAATHTK